MAGKPRGAWADKAFRDALRKAVLERDGLTKIRKLDALAQTLVTNGLAGDTSAIREVADRLDGKASQPIEHSGHLDIAMTLDRVITEMRERELAMRPVEAERLN